MIGPSKRNDMFEKYDEHKLKLKEFIETFEDIRGERPQPGYERYGRRKYLMKLQDIANERTGVMEIELEDLKEFFGKEDEKEMVKAFTTNVKRYVSLFEDVAQELMPARMTTDDEELEIKYKFETILNSQRMSNMEAADQRARGENEKLPNEALRKFNVSIVYGPDSKMETLSIRQLKSQYIGSLVNCKAVVVRASDVKPLIIMATYTCDSCGCENYQPVLSKEYMPRIVCTSMKCKENKVNGKLTFQPGSSTFTSFQQLKIQETADQLIDGNIPRTYTVQVRGDLVRQAVPGDMVMIQGVLLPNRKQGFRHNADILFDSYIEAYKITREKRKYTQLAISEESRRKIFQMTQNMSDDEMFNKLSKSIAPEIFGLENVKKALLLLMVGGITKVTEDNLKIRGQINIALIGDPGIAKSQLLKHISYVSPRGVYTTGKGSSGVGLTASIIKDPVTNELSLEAGALVLADMGVCCIDEFDKMDEYDRTAIHEVMEQQSVSIAKAGIVTSLNARASILAAANPLYGRYNKKETPHKNINLPAALLSRFDLIFILQDKPQKEQDRNLAFHICNVHRHRQAPVGIHFDSQLLRNYIAIAKQYEPVIPQALHKQFIDRYISKRKEQADLSKQGYSYTTTRTLLGLIRLCQARARLRFSSEVSRQDLQECMTLIEESQASVQVDDMARKPKTDKTSAIYGIIRDSCQYDGTGMALQKDIESRVLKRGYTLEDFKKTLEEYHNMNVLMFINDKVMITG